MKLFDNFLNLNIQKLFLKGNITKAYKNMYSLAEDIAAYELRGRIQLFHKIAKRKTAKNPKDYTWEYLEEMEKYKEKRINYHINEMKEFLKLREKIKK